MPVPLPLEKMTYLELIQSSFVKVTHVPQNIYSRDEKGFRLLFRAPPSLVVVWHPKFGCNCSVGLRQPTIPHMESPAAAIFSSSIDLAARLAGYPRQVASRSLLL
jgi:hypothetical protein